MQIIHNYFGFTKGQVLEKGEIVYMILKLIGALFVVVGCGGIGFRIASNHRFEEKNLRQLIGILDYMECELQYRSTALVELCEQTAQQCQGKMKSFFITLYEELASQISPDVGLCMDITLQRCADLPEQIKELCKTLGRNLGKFDLQGQLKGLEVTRKECREKLEVLLFNKDTRIRSYQTLGLCAGAALAILFV